MNYLSYISKHSKPYFALFAGAVMLIVLVGCTQDYGRFSRDADLDQAFNKGEILPELNYYYSGIESKPSAIIGVDPAYLVPSRFWIAFEPQPEQLKKMRKRVYSRPGYAYFGWYMLDQDGTAIGVWFYGPHTRSFKVDQQKRIVQPMYVIQNIP